MTTTQSIDFADIAAANADFGQHGDMVIDYVADKMGAAASDLIWTLETFDVAQATPDPSGIRQESRVAAAARLIESGEAPAIVVIETPKGRRIHVDGWHRLGAAERLGLTTVPAYVGRRAA